MPTPSAPHLAGIVLAEEHMTVDATKSVGRVLIDINTEREGIHSHQLVVFVDGEIVFTGPPVETVEQ